MIMTWGYGSDAAVEWCYEKNCFFDSQSEGRRAVEIALLPTFASFSFLTPNNVL
jgi:hypothetical protein